MYKNRGEEEGVGSGSVRQVGRVGWPRQLGRTDGEADPAAEQMEQLRQRIAAGWWAPIGGLEGAEAKLFG